MIKRKSQLTYIMTTSIQKEVNLQVKNKIESLSQENKTENYSAGLLHQSKILKNTNANKTRKCWLNEMPMLGRTNARQCLCIRMLIPRYANAKQY